MSLNRYVKLVRGNKESIAKMMDECEAWLARGVPVLLFPEGTRSPDGEVQPFKDGAFRLATKMKCPVIPIAITGTSRTLPKHGFLLETRADCIVRVLPPIPSDAFGDDVGALRDHVREVIMAEKVRIERPMSEVEAPSTAQTA
jgi:1-acyl-sn-glycerol-3-phosphate acyltransferase